MIFEPSIAYQGCQSTGGKYTHLPEFYQEFARHAELKRMQFIREEESKRKQQAHWDDFFNRFDPFGNFGEREMPCSYEDIDPEDEKDYPFSVFSLKRTASQEDMKKAYRKGILEHHPDKNKEDTTEAFRVIQEAYEYYELHLC